MILFAIKQWEKKS